jgi:hypothetical protein
MIEILGSRGKKLSGDSNSCDPRSKYKTLPGRLSIVKTTPRPTVVHYSFSGIDETASNEQKYAEAHDRASWWLMKKRNIEKLEVTRVERV